MLTPFNLFDGLNEFIICMVIFLVSNEASEFFVSSVEMLMIDPPSKNLFDILRWVIDQSDDYVSIMR